MGKTYLTAIFLTHGYIQKTLHESNMWISFKSDSEFLGGDSKNNQIINLYLRDLKTWLFGILFVGRILQKPTGLSIPQHFTAPAHDLPIPQLRAEWDWCARYLESWWSPPARFLHFLFLPSCLPQKIPAPLENQHDNGKTSIFRCISY